MSRRRSYTLFAAIAIPIVLGGAPRGAELEAQAPEPAASATAVEPVLAQTAPSGLPERAPAPRTLRDYWHLFIAYAVVWVLLFGYVLSIGRRTGRLEEELRRMSG